MKKILLLNLMALALIFQGTLNAQVGTKITQTTLVKAKINSVVHNSCFGDKRGAINLMVSGGIPPYKYHWSNGATTQDVAGLPAGIYKVKVVDSYGCPDSLTVEIKEPPKLTLAVDSVQDILCYGFTNGMVNISVNGGVTPYVYSWSNGASTQNLKNVEAGEYALLVTDANHCQEILSAVVKQNPLIVKSDEKVQNVDCSGDSTGKIDIQVSGGVAPYRYKWTSGQITEDLSKLVAGTYTVMVTDSRGCIESYSTAVKEPNPIILALEEVRNINCADDKSGAINVSVKGGVAPYFFSWNDTLAKTKDLAGIGKGNYHLVVADSKKCKKELSQEIKEPPKLNVKIESVKNVLNYGGTDGAVYIKVNGGIEPYRYEWSNGARSQNVANIPANNYTCRIIDANNCVNMISVKIDQPALLEVNIERLENNKCFNEKNGYINTIVKGGVQPYKFLWSNGDTTKDVKNLAAGTYSLTVTDANGMVKTLKGTIEQPGLLKATTQSVTDIPCYGNFDGIIDINVEGGSPPYNYNWSNGAKTQDLTKVAAGNYTVQIIDNNRCIDSLKATIKQSSQIEVKPLDVVDIKCNGKAEGAISVDISGGVPPYVFKWNNGANTRNLTNLIAGEYSLRVSDSKGCDKTLSVNIKEPSLLVTSLAEVTDVKCKGDSTGSINTIVKGGTAPYTYLWSDGKTTSNNRNIKAGGYTVKIVDAKGCANTLTTTIKEPPKLQSSLDKVENIDCFDDKTGAIYVSVGGGIPPYVYKWNNNATTQNLLGIAAGDYTLNIKDQNNCTSIVQATVLQNKALNSSVQNIVHVNCNGFKTGAAQINIVGGVEPYTYKWSNGAITKDLVNVGAGSYKLIISDSKGCTNSLNLAINEPTLFQGVIDSLRQIGCNGDSNGAIFTSFKGGITPYTYEWTNSKTSEDIKNLKAGIYTLTAKDHNGCVSKLEAELVQPSKLILKLIALKHNLCNGERNGAIDISVEGGVMPYTYEWNNGATTQDQSSLAAGNYKVKVIGATGCETGLDAEVTQPAPLNLKVVSAIDVNCNGGNNGFIDLAVSGGKEPYTYSWSNGAITQDIKNLVAGSYTAFVTDANSCVNKISAIIKQPEPLVATLADVKNINCFGDSTGAIYVDVKGGTQPYAYKWSNGASTEDIDNLKIGNYTVEIKDTKGCTQSLKATITQPELMVSKVVSTVDVLCNGLKEGSVDISVSGGVMPYIYTWSNGNKEQDLSNVGAGKYNVNIKDANGCTRELSAEIKEPSMLIVSVAEIKNIIEHGSKNGAVSISVSGGSAPYFFSWSNGATTQNISNLEAGDYSVIVNDLHLCREDLNVKVTQPEVIAINIDTIHHIKCYGEKTGFAKLSAKGGSAPYTFTWDNGVSGQEIKNVQAGTYTLTFKDANGVTKQKQVIIEQPELFELKIDSVKNPSCYELNNGRIKTEVKGGTMPYSFLWNTGATTQNIKGLTSGKYSLKVTDAKGCMLSDSIQLTKPEALIVTLLNIEHIKCNAEPKGKVNIGVSGGTPPYKFNWDHGSVEQNLANIRAGNYTVKVIDANQCFKSLSATVNEPPALVSKFESIKNVPCQGEKKGLITTSTTGGVPPYSCRWSNGDTSCSANYLLAGNYSVVISDANGCTNNLATTITEPEKLAGSILNVTDINCNGDKEGVISIDVKGGTIPYTYDWSNGSKAKNQVNIIAGEYSIRVIDAQGCELNMKAEVKQPSKLIATLANISHIKCFGDNAGAIDVNVTGGVEPYLYTWSNGASTQDLVKIKAGNYSLMVKDAKGCFSSLNAAIEEPAKLSVTSTSVSNIKCNSLKTGEIIISVKGGKEPYSYNWSNGATTRDIQNISAGLYKLTVADANECLETFSASVSEPPLLIKSIDAVKHINCFGESNGFVNLSVSGGTVPYTYQWSNGVNTQDLIDVPAGKYSVLIKEGNGCESSLDVTITEPTLFKSALLGVSHNNCFGEKNGTIDISVEGGTLPYSFKWNNGASTQNLKGIASGDYAVLVSDANGCNNTIKASVNEPPKLVLTVDSARNVKCCGDTSGAIFISVKGGVPPYKYKWSHGATTQDITGLAQGQYTVEVTDAHLCIVNTPEEGTSIYEKIIAQGKFVTRDILFDVGKATIKEASFIEISRIASFMKEHPQMKFSVEGHTDSQGDDAFNMKLSEERASSIKDALIKFGIAEYRLEVKGWGETKPIDTNNTPEGRAANRRVEFIPL